MPGDRYRSHKSTGYKTKKQSHVFLMCSFFQNLGEPEKRLQNHAFIIFDASHISTNKNTTLGHTKNSNYCISASKRGGWRGLNTQPHHRGNPKKPEKTTHLLVGKAPHRPAAFPPRACHGDRSPLNDLSTSETSMQGAGVIGRVVESPKLRDAPNVWIFTHILQ